MIFREARLEDIQAMTTVRESVKENKLSHPSRVTIRDYENYLSERGRGWVCESGNRLVGFGIADLVDHNVWALFVHPWFERMGIGKQLHDAMLNWYFEQTNTAIWLGTAPGTRAEKFYRKAGWTEVGKHGPTEIKFEMTMQNWMCRRNTQESH